MTSEKFVNVINQVVKEESIDGIINNLQEPAGRKPAPELVLLSEWYNRQDKDTKELIKKIISYSVDFSVFSFLCVIDGVAAIESSTQKGKLALHYIGGGKDVLLNNPEEDYLHNIYRDI